MHPLIFSIKSNGVSQNLIFMQCYLSTFLSLFNTDAYLLSTVISLHALKKYEKLIAILEQL